MTKENSSPPIETAASAGQKISLVWYIKKGNMPKAVDNTESVIRTPLYAKPLFQYAVGKKHEFNQLCN